MNFIDHKDLMPSLKEIRSMKKSELKNYLERRGFCVDGDSIKEMRELALDDWNEEHKGGTHE